MASIRPDPGPGPRRAGDHESSTDFGAGESERDAAAFGKGDTEPDPAAGGTDAGGDEGGPDGADDGVTGALMGSGVDDAVTVMGDLMGGLLDPADPFEGSGVDDDPMGEDQAAGRNVFEALSDLGAGSEKGDADDLDELDD